MAIFRFSSRKYWPNRGSGCSRRADHSSEGTREGKADVLGLVKQYVTSPPSIMVAWMKLLDSTSGICCPEPFHGMACWRCAMLYEESMPYFFREALLLHPSLSASLEACLYLLIFKI